MQKYQLFFKMVFRSLLFRKLATTAAILAIVLGTGVIGALVSLYFDINEKMSKEFRAYGANVFIYSADKNSEINSQVVEEIRNEITDKKLIGIAPMQYSIVNIKETPVVLVGTWLDEMKQVNPYWSINGNLVESRENMTDGLVGKNIAEKYDLKPGSTITILNDHNQSFPIVVKGIISSGDKEENQIFVNSKLANEISGKSTFNIILLSLLGKGMTVEKESARLQAKISDIEVHPIKQMAQSEEKVLIKIQQLTRFVLIIIFIITILTVTLTMISMINERRKEVGLKKALGASHRKLLLEFLTEGVLISIIGSSIGIIAAYFIAQLIGKSVFQSEISFQFFIIPTTYAVSLLIVAISFFFPVRRIMDVEPAIVLKGN